MKKINDKQNIFVAIYDTAIAELEAIKSNIKSSIEEIEYALAKPEYAEVYLNNALRFLNEKQYNI